MRVPLSKPWVTQEDVESVVNVLNTTYLSFGPKLNEFEEMLAATANRKYAIAVNSGTSALHLIIRALSIKDGDEVITTPFSFIASSNCILFERAKPVFVDIRKDNYNIDPSIIKSKVSDKTKAILVVDVFGHPADLDELGEITKESNLKLIEDSAEAIGSEYKGKKAGSFGVAGIFGFYPNKQITTGEGGAVLTDSEEVAILSRSLRNQGRGEGDKWLQHTRIGYNFRISDINCALGISQLKRLPEIIEKRNSIAKLYVEKLKDVEEIVTPFVDKSVTRMSWFVFVIRLADKFTSGQRDLIIRELANHGIETRGYFSAIHLQPSYRGRFGFKEGDFPITESVSQRTVALPFYTIMTEDEVSYVVDNLKEAIARGK